MRLNEYFISIYISFQFLTIPYSVGWLSSSNDLYLDAQSPTMISFNCRSYPKDYSDRSIGRPTKEAKLALGKLSPANPIFIYPVPGSQITAAYDFINYFIQISSRYYLKHMYSEDHQGQQPSQNQHEYYQQQIPGSVSYEQVDPLTKLNASLSLSKTMPPSKLKKNLICLAQLAPEIQDNLLEKIEMPLQIDDSNPNFPYLRTQFNRDGDSYRNPYTNFYSPENLNGYKPSGHFRELEESGGLLFAEYVRQYYGNDTVGSFYVLESDHNKNNFSCGFFAKKTSNEGDGFQGNWDSFNIVDVSHDGNSYHYSLKSTVLIEMAITNNNINLSGFLKKNKQHTKTYKGQNQSQILVHHLQTIGELIEELQTVMRQHLEAIYVAKTKQIIFTTRFEHTMASQNVRMSLANDLKKRMFGQ